MKRPRQVLKPSSLTNQAVRIRSEQARFDEMEASVIHERRRGGGIGPGGPGDPSGTAASLMSAHVANPDPHSQYVTQDELDGYLATLGSGTYKPNGTAAVNCSSLSTGNANWMRVGSVVTVAGSIESVTVTDPDTPTEFHLSLPVPSTFNETADGASGVVSSPIHSAHAGTIRAIPEANAVSLRFLSVGAGSISDLRYTFTYRISA